MLRPPTAQLRVYVDVDDLPSREREHWRAYVEAGRGLTRVEADEAQARMAVSYVLAAPVRVPSGALVRRAGRRRLVCPLDLETRTSWAWGRLQDEVSPSVLRELVQDEDARRALDRAARSARPPTILDNPWSVPLQWYLLFDPEEHRRTDPPEGRGPRSRFVTTVGQAADRVDRAIRVVTEAVPADPDGTLVGAVELAGWLDGFPDEAVLELDYGALAEDLPAPQDHACADLHRAVDALESGDLLEAVTAYGVARACWGDRRDHARRN